MKYRVDIFETISHSRWVEAESRDEAISIAYESVMNDAPDNRIVGESTESLGTQDHSIDVYEIKED